MGCGVWNYGVGAAGVGMGAGTVEGEGEGGGVENRAGGGVGERVGGGQWGDGCYTECCTGYFTGCGAVEGIGRFVGETSSP